MKNKIFKVQWDGETDVIFAMNEKSAIEYCVDFNNIEESSIEGCEEVPESEWDKKCGIVYEDNNREYEAYDITYLELYSPDQTYPEIMISTNMDWL